MKHVLYCATITAIAFLIVLALTFAVVCLCNTAEAIFHPPLIEGPVIQIMPTPEEEVPGEPGVFREKPHGRI